MGNSQTKCAVSLATRTIRAGVSAVAALGLLFFAQEAQAQIKHPGAHPRYSVELEPHLGLWWSGYHHNYYTDGDAGVGLGGRVSIPLMDNGPIKTINNNMAIGFGLDWGHFGGHCSYYGNPRYYDPRYAGDCSTDAFWIPVVLQWNFFITKTFSAFGEPGLAIRHSRWNWPGGYCADNRGQLYACDWNTSETAFEPFVFFVGGRVHASETVSFTFRLGWPYVSLGASFFL